MAIFLFYLVVKYFFGNSEIGRGRSWKAPISLKPGSAKGRANARPVNAREAASRRPLIRLSLAIQSDRIGSDIPKMLGLVLRLPFGQRSERHTQQPVIDPEVSIKAMNDGLRLGERDLLRHHPNILGITP